MAVSFIIQKVKILLSRALAVDLRFEITQNIACLKHKTNISHTQYVFLYEDLLNSVTEYVQKNRDHVLSEITDVLYSFDHRLGGYFGVTPSHFIIMRNVLQGLDKKQGCKKWDLKPPNFFEPTRDLVPDPMKTEAAKSGLADEMDESIVLTRKQRSELM